MPIRIITIIKPPRPLGAQPPQKGGGLSVSVGGPDRPKRVRKSDVTPAMWEAQRVGEAVIIDLGEEVEIISVTEDGAKESRAKRES